MKEFNDRSVWACKSNLFCILMASSIRAMLPLISAPDFLLINILLIAGYDPLASMNSFGKAAMQGCLWRVVGGWV